jgi:hypothetical protein
VAECLLGKWKALSSKPSKIKTNKQKKNTSITYMVFLWTGEKLRQEAVKGDAKVSKDHGPCAILLDRFIIMLTELH